MVRIESPSENQVQKIEFYMDSFGGCSVFLVLYAARKKKFVRLAMAGAHRIRPDIVFSPEGIEAVGGMLWEMPVSDAAFSRCFSGMLRLGVEDWDRQYRGMRDDNFWKLHISLDGCEDILCEGKGAYPEEWLELIGVWDRLTSLNLWLQQMLMRAQEWRTE